MPIKRHRKEPHVVSWFILWATWIHAYSIFFIQENKGWNGRFPPFTSRWVLIHRALDSPIRFGKEACQVSVAETELLIIVSAISKPRMSISRSYVTFPHNRAIHSSWRSLTLKKLDQDLKSQQLHIWRYWFENVQDRILVESFFQARSSSKQIRWQLTGFYKT